MELSKKDLSVNKGFDKHKAVNILLAVFIAVISFYIIYSTQGISYQTNDDAQLANIAAGAYGDWLHMIYVNIVFSVILRPFYALYHANWYVIVQLVLIIISIAVSAYIILKKAGTLAGTVMVTSLMIAFSEHIFYTFQYTECSFIVIAAGLLVMVDNLGEISMNTLFGIALTAFGTMIRWDSFYAVGAMSAPLLLVTFFRQSSDKKKKAIISMLLLFSVTFGLEFIDVMCYRLDPEWNEFVQYNAARTRYSDYRTFSLPQHNPFTHLGISDLDYAVLNSWNYYDEEKFDTELLNQLSEYTREITMAELFEETKQAIKNMTVGKSYNYMLMAVAVFSLFQIRFRLATLSMAGVYGMFVCLVAYLTYNVRFPSWVLTGLIWTLVVFSFYCASDMRSNKVITFITAAVLMVYISQITYPGYMRMCSKAAEYNAAVRNGYEYIDWMSQDKENLYLLSTASALESAGMDITDPRKDNYFSNIVTYGDWLSRAPHRNTSLAKYNVERPIVDAVNNPNVYLDRKSIDMAVRYARQELGVEVLAVETGKNEYAPYQLITKEK